MSQLTEVTDIVDSIFGNVYVFLLIIRSYQMASSELVAIVKHLTGIHFIVGYPIYIFATLWFHPWI